MRKWISALLAVILIITSMQTVIAEESVSDVPDFGSLSDPALLQYVEDTVYSDIVEQFASEDYVIENVEAVYYSKEYMEEFAYNSQANIFFGYTLAELDAQFAGQKYIFTLGEDGTTIVEPFEDYDDTYDRVIKNIMIGSGVILVCVTVSVVTAGAGAVPISMVFAASADTAASMAISSGTISAVAAGTVTAIQTGDMEQALKAAALQGSESFKWGAISGAIIGGVTELSIINNYYVYPDDFDDVFIYDYDEYFYYNEIHSVEIADDLPMWRQAELRALNEFRGYEQLAYLDGKCVNYATAGSTRPDIINVIGDHIEAIEVKYYDLSNNACLNHMYSELQREISARVVNLPAGSTQRVVLDVTNRNFSAELIQEVVANVQNCLVDIYPNIPVDVFGLL